MHPMTDEPRWLAWSRELLALAQTGIAFSRDPYDLERYARLREIAAQMLAARTGDAVADLVARFSIEQGYATPKVEVRAAAFDSSGRILMVREALDHDRWTLPGGWADVNLTPVENVLKEVREESGYEVRVLKLAAAWDRARQGHPPSMHACVKLFYVCEPTGGQARTSLETTEVAWFAREAVPTDLSTGRVLRSQIERMFEHAAAPGLPADFE
jgi:ADP-ribose pyrophosphatase YjhB (NUDIX family)